jgi:hypothetical protein
MNDAQAWLWRQTADLPLQQAHTMDFFSLFPSPYDLQLAPKRSDFLCYSLTLNIAEDSCKVCGLTRHGVLDSVNAGCSLVVNITL